MQERVRAMQGLYVLRALGKRPSKPASLLGLMAARARWVSNSAMMGFAMCISVRGKKV